MHITSAFGSATATSTEGMSGSTGGGREVEVEDFSSSWISGSSWHRAFLQEEYFLAVAGDWGGCESTSWLYLCSASARHTWMTSPVSGRYEGPVPIVDVREISLLASLELSCIGRLFVTESTIDLARSRSVTPPFRRRVYNRLKKRFLLHLAQRPFISSFAAAMIVFKCLFCLADCL